MTPKKIIFFANSTPVGVVICCQLTGVTSAGRNDYHDAEMLSQIEYLIEKRMAHSNYSHNHGIVLKSVTETGVGLPHDLRSNYSDMLELVGSTTEKAHCYLCESERQTAPMLF